MGEIDAYSRSIVDSYIDDICVVGIKKINSSSDILDSQILHAIVPGRIDEDAFCKKWDTFGIPEPFEDRSPDQYFDSDLCLNGRFFRPVSDHGMDDDGLLKVEIDLYFPKSRLLKDLEALIDEKLQYYKRDHKNISHSINCSITCLNTIYASR